MEDIIELIEAYPEFRPLYETLYGMCENIEGVMSMFSEELYQLDKNTAEFMVDEFGRIIEEQKTLLAQKDDELAQKDDVIAQQNAVIVQLQKQILEGKEY